MASMSVRCSPRNFSDSTDTARPGAAAHIVRAALAVSMPVGGGVATAGMCSAGVRSGFLCVGRGQPPRPPTAPDRRFCPQMPNLGTSAAARPPGTGTAGRAEGLSANSTVYAPRATGTAASPPSRSTVATTPSTCVIVSPAHNCWPLCTAGPAHPSGKAENEMMRSPGLAAKSTMPRLPSLNVHWMCAGC